VKSQAPAAEQVAWLLAGCTQAVHALPQLNTVVLLTHTWPQACWAVGQEQVPLPHVAPCGQSAVRRQPGRQPRVTGSQK
jgi:hypothetical protein